MIARRLILGVTAAVLVLTISACRSAPTRVFSLEPVMPISVASTYTGPPIRIDTVHIPPSLDRIEIATEVGSGEFKIHDLDQWVAPLGQVVQQTLTADLIARLPQGRVIFPYLAKPAGSIGISVDLLVFSANREGAKLQASWAGGSDVPGARTCGGTMVLQTSLSSTGSVGLVGALSALLGQLADHMAADLLLSEPPK
jgi:uncharacterized lipoprotein YmbA